MKRKAISLFLVLATAMCLMLGGCGKTKNPDSSGAGGGNVTNATFTLEEVASGYSVKGLKDKSVTEIVVPSEIKGKPVTEIADSAFKDLAKVTSVVIPDSVIKSVKTL